MPRGKIVHLEKEIDLRKPVRECAGVGAVEITDDRTIEDLSNQLADALLAVAQISAASSEILIGLQQSMRRRAHVLLANPETKELGEALQRLALRVQTAVGNPPKQRTERMEAESSPFNTDLWDSLDFSVRVSNAVKNFLTKKLGIDKKDLTVRNFFDAFSKNGHFDSSEFRTTKGVGDTTFDEFITVLKDQNQIITDADDWSPAFLEKYSL